MFTPRRTFRLVGIRVEMMGVTQQCHRSHELQLTAMHGTCACQHTDKFATVQYDCATFPDSMGRFKKNFIAIIFDGLACNIIIST